MKDKGEMMSPPSGRPKRRSVRQKQNDSTSISQEKKEANGIVAKKKKIKIRLKDPNNPESFVCEIFDSSLDESDTKVEDSDVLDSSLEIKEASNGLGSEKPKNYFDILMSKESRRNFNVISAVENEKIPEESKLNRIEESEEVINERKSVKKRNEERLTEMLEAKKTLRKKIIESCSDSSDDETLFSVRSKLKSQTEKLKKQNGLVNSMQSKLSSILKINQDLSENGSVSECSKETSNSEPRKKAPNILNYFTKIENNSDDTKAKAKSKVKKQKKLKEIDMFQNMKKPSWEVQLKNPDEEDESETKEVTGDSDNEDIIDFPTKKNNKNQSKTKNSNNSENVKLAPLFQKKVKKAIDPEVQKARLEFLHSGLPSAVKKAAENQKNQIELDVVYFPVVSHIQQKDEDPFWALQNISLPFKDTTDYVFENRPQFRFKIEGEKSINEVDNLEVEREDDALKRMRYRYKNVDVDRIFNGLKEKHEKFAEKIREIENVQKSTPDDSIEVIENDNVEIFNTLWTEKYKPKSSEILGNVSTVRKLGKWLEAWKAFEEEMKRLAKLGVKVKSKAAADNSSDDFITSDEDDYGIRSPANTCLLSGPNGCGKTALVYALANELEFNVLEVNASSKRTGKKLLTDLQEATQSHKVHHEIGSQPLANLFEKSGNNKNKKKLKLKKRKKKKEVQPDQPNNSCKMSLILIEDADIVFEEYDEGFVPAIVTLVQSSKRPVIFLTSDPSCTHLDKIRTPSCVVLEMERPGFVSSCAVLDMISVLEGVHVKKEAIESIVEQNHNDLRKSLLEFQFWLCSGQPLTSVPMPSTLGRTWWGCNKFLYNDEIKHKAKPKPSKRKRINELFDSSDEELGIVKKLKTNDEDSTATTSRPPVEKVKEAVKRDPGIHHYSKILDAMCMVDMLHSPKDEEPIPEWEYRPIDSLSLVENMESVKFAEADISKGLVKELIDLSSRIFIKNRNINDRKLNLDNPSWEEISWRKQQEEAKMELTYLVPFCSGKEKRNLNLDYLPIIRNICRTEKHRFSSNTKRKNRFYHYLRTLGADPNDENVDISCDVLKFES